MAAVKSIEYRSQMKSAPPSHQLAMQGPLITSPRGKSLYIGAHCVAIEGMPYDSTRALIDGLTEFATQQRYLCRHHWRPHDTIIWDNRASLFSIAMEKYHMVQPTIAVDTPIVTDAV